MSTYSLLGGTDVPVKLDGTMYTVCEWEPGQGFPITGCDLMAMDTETEPVVKGNLPVPVVMQIAGADCSSVVFVKPEHFEAALVEADRVNPGAQWGLFNAPFDCKVAGWPDSILWDIFQEGRLTCLLIRGTLHTLQAGSYKPKLGLDALSKMLLRWQLVKDKDITLSFRPGVRLTSTQIDYAAQDPVATVRCLQALPDKLPTEDLSIRGHFALSYVGDVGFLQDEVRREALTKELIEKQKYYFTFLQLMGMAPGVADVPGEKVKSPVGINNRKQELLHSLETIHGVDLPRTISHGKRTETICSEKKTLDIALITLDIPIPMWLQAYREFDHARKICNTYLRDGIAGTDGRVHPYFNPMVKTGRTSCSRPNIQNVPRKGGVRGIYIPSPGYYLLASDYSQLELCTLAQSCWSRFKQSRMREIINDGGDLHLWLGDILIHKEGKQHGVDFTDPKDSTRLVYRQIAKAANFGLPGGLGAATFVAFARNYDVELSLDKAKELKETWMDAFPEMRLHLKPKVDEYWTEKNIRQWLAKHKLSRDGIRTLTDLESYLHDLKFDETDIYRVSSQLSAYICQTITGRVKRNCSFCAAANMEFQAPAADGAKLALWAGYLRAWRMVDFVHDEIIQEVLAMWEAQRLQEHVALVEGLMISEMRRVTPDVEIRVESALMDRWYKEAKPLHDANGNLMLWTPELAKMMEEEKKRKTQAKQTAA